MNSVSFQSHNHKQCQKSAIQQAERICKSLGERLTPLRKTVLEFVWLSHEPIKAYDLLGKLQAIHPSSAPPTVYRALDFLLKMGLIHKIESLNAYLGCTDPSAAHSCQFLICECCGSAAEVESTDVNINVEKVVDAFDFEFQTMNLEIHGRCHQCKDKDEHK